MKNCTKCNITKPLYEFSKSKVIKSGYKSTCKLCDNEYLKNNRVKKNNSTTHKYEKTFKGKLVRTYRNMLSRVTGVLKTKKHLYNGLDILNKESFYEWSINNNDYNSLYKNWKDNDYILILSPSIDRIDPLIGYTVENIRWVTHSENSTNTNRHK